MGVIAGTIPRDILIAIWASIDFWYLCQVEEIDNGCCNRIQATLNEFHAHKSAITDAGACVGVGNRPINNWYILKLKMMQSVISNIQANGAIIQYSADVMEHAHIMEIKNPAQAGNNQRYEAQICHDLDCTDRLCHFELATMIQDPHLRLSDYSDVDNNPLTAAQLVNGSHQSHNNYFNKASHIQNNDQALHPLHTFTESHITFHLNCSPSFKQMTIDDMAEKFGLPDLCPTLTDFLCHYMPDNSANYVIGGRQRAAANTDINFSKIEIWSGVHIQMKTFHNANKVTPSQLINACLPPDNWPLGCYDNVIVNMNDSKHWPWSGLDGMLRFHLLAQCNGFD